MSPRPPCRYAPLARVSAAFTLAAGLLPAQTAPAPVPAISAPAGETVVLSPFEVVADTRGYLATNTMSGTRLNTKLEDLASAITVITKEQMADFAMLDLNDLFLYGANTEGTGTYTDFVAEDGQGNISDNVSGDPHRVFTKGKSGRGRRRRRGGRDSRPWRW